MNALQRAQKSLEGLAVGDAFGETFFMSWEMAVRYQESGKLTGPPYDFTDDFIQQLIDSREIQLGPWRWTDDTAMAIEIVECLAAHGEIVSDDLAQRFSLRYKAEPNRGYGGAMHSLLPALAYESWQKAAPNLFEGQGSYGNGAAMRVAPLGAYFADDLDACIENARRSALVTHAHEEGVAGAIAVAVAAAYATHLGTQTPHGVEFLDLVLPLIPDSEVKNRIVEARSLADATTGEEAALDLGSGYAVSAQDTVPFVLWCAAQHPDNYEEALWLTVSGLGDRDTTCAMVGGIVVNSSSASIPSQWQANSEPITIL
ncbi:MAG TPA: ADP-ribosylglycohydrolase family protein [Abditibacteriaceae bacterium]|jgi:ADP-ribosylglycohydrolase